MADPKKYKLLGGYNGNIAGKFVRVPKGAVIEGSSEVASQIKALHPEWLEEVEDWPPQFDVAAPKAPVVTAVVKEEDPKVAKKDAAIKRVAKADHGPKRSSSK
jgi:hypothetical protein